MLVEEDVYLEHFGVKGMKWGVRKDTSTGASRGVDKHAKRDAKEFAAAKQFFGEGAGTRRKLINATVEGKAKRLPGYQKAFDHHLSKQDTSKHAEKAQSERKRIDRKTRAKQRGGAVLRRVTGEPGTQAALVAAVIGGGVFLNSPQGRAVMSKVVKNVSAKSSVITDKMKQKHNATKIASFIKTQAGSKGMRFSGLSDM